MFNLHYSQFEITAYASLREHLKKSKFLNHSILDYRVIYICQLSSDDTFKWWYIFFWIETTNSFMWLYECVSYCHPVTDEGPMMLSDLPSWSCAVWSPAGSRENVAWRRTHTACLTHTWPRLMAPQIFIIILPNSSQVWPWARPLPPKSTEVKYVMWWTWQESRSTLELVQPLL